MKPILIGLLLFAGVPFAVLLAAITVIGIPVALAGLAGYLILLYAARLLVAAVVGERILGSPTTRMQSFLRLALGLGIYSVAVEIPYLGVVIALLAMFLGLGAFGLRVFRGGASARPPVSTPAPPVPATTG